MQEISSRTAAIFIRICVNNSDNNSNSNDDDDDDDDDNFAKTCERKRGGCRR